MRVNSAFQGQAIMAWTRENKKNNHNNNNNTPVPSVMMAATVDQIPIGAAAACCVEWSQVRREKI